MYTLGPGGQPHGAFFLLLTYAVTAGHARGGSPLG